MRGECLNYKSIWDYLLQLTTEAKLVEKVWSGHWIWSYDNLNIYCSVRHERQGEYTCIYCRYSSVSSPYTIPDHESHMLNVTSRLASEMRHVPEDVDWADSSPQGSRTHLTAADILPDVDDTSVLRKRALLYLQHFIVTEFSALSELHQVLPALHPCGGVTKTNVVPMKILFRDEKYAAENVEILHDLVKNAALIGTNQVM